MQKRGRIESDREKDKARKMEGDGHPPRVYPFARRPFIMLDVGSDSHIVPPYVDR